MEAKYYLKIFYVNSLILKKSSRHKSNVNRRKQKDFVSHGDEDVKIMMNIAIELASIN